MSGNDDFFEVELSVAGHRQNVWVFGETRWWPFTIDGRPCAWPVTEVSHV